MPGAFFPEISLAKQNFRQAKRQRELARKTRQQEKQQRRSNRSSTEPAGVVDEASTNKS
ncbi:MAG: hypothetical protein ACRETX_00045 [Steroidobacteraceae bacterium]